MTRWTPTFGFECVLWRLVPSRGVVLGCELRDLNFGVCGSGFLGFRFKTVSDFGFRVQLKPTPLNPKPYKAWRPPMTLAHALRV